MTFSRAINAKSSLLYSKTDPGTGICRITPHLFGDLGVKLGYILHIELTFDNFNCTVVCTLWPCIDENTPKDIIYVDDTVRLVEGTCPTNWTECNCKVHCNLCDAYTEIYLHRTLDLKSFATTSLLVDFL